MNDSGMLRFIGLVSITVFLLTAFTPLPNALAEWSRVHADLQAADAIVVLASSVDAKGTLSTKSLRRAVEGMVLYQKKLAPVVVLSGPANRAGVVEAHVRAELAHTLGIPAAAIITETTARTTREEAMRLAELLQPRGVRRILLVTDTFHMPRSLRFFEQEGFVVHPAPVDDLAQAGGPESRLKLMRELAQEFLARLYNHVAGYL
jgi:uncharacterized SAM-binding protein YcdF (DUF218 family)